MKKYLLIGLLLLAMIMTLVACGSDENSSDTDVKNPAPNQTKVEVPNDSNDTDDPDTPVVDEDTSENPYEGIDMESALPGREWVQTTFPGVIDTPKIVIYNDATNRKTIVEEGEVVVYNESDTFAMYLPEGVIVTEYSYLLNEATRHGCCEEVVFDMEKLKEYDEKYKEKIGGAKYNVKLNNNGEELSCIISLGD